MFILTMLSCCLYVVKYDQIAQRALSMTLYPTCSNPSLEELFMARKPRR